MQNMGSFVKILKFFLSLCFGIFAARIGIYALSALSLLDNAKKTNIAEFLFLFIGYFIIPILFYIVSIVGLLTTKNWVWYFIIFGGLIVVIINLPNVILRPTYMGVYLLALLVFVLCRNK